MMRSSVLVITVALVCSAMAVPSPSDEENEVLRPKRNRNPNNYDEEHSIECPNGYGLCNLKSEHNNDREDRIFDYACCRVTGTVRSASCTWTHYGETYYDEPISFMCPRHQYMGGTASRHDNSREDRQFKYQCCSGGFTSRGCEMTNFLAGWDQKIDYSAPRHGYIIAGTASKHSNQHE